MMYFLSILFVVLGYVVTFVIIYFITWFGLRILKIEGIKRRKIITYIFLMLLISFLLSPFTNRILAAIHNVYFFYLVNIIYSFVINLIVIKYYLSLSGQKLWQFTLYNVISGLIVSLALTGLTRF
jgi:hypothetical protein